MMRIFSYSRSRMGWICNATTLTGGQYNHPNHHNSPPSAPDTNTDPWRTAPTRPDKTSSSTGHPNARTDICDFAMTFTLSGGYPELKVTLDIIDHDLLP